MKTLDLPSEMIAIHPNIQTSDQLLTTLLGGIGGLGQQNQPCTRAPSWFALDSENKVKSVYWTLAGVPLVEG